MCTVSFVPVKNGFVLTSNRDEIISRATLFPQKHQENKTSLWYPKDQEAGGSWIAADLHGNVACVLNGAFKKHKRNPPYRMSRGSLLKLAFHYDSFTEFAEEIDLKNIENFTLVLVQNAPSLKLIEIKWDGTNKQVTVLDQQNWHLWSSPTLYDQKEHTQKLSWFSQDIVKNGTDAESIRNIHSKKHGVDPTGDFISDFGNGLKTRSISQIITGDKISFKHDDLVENISKEIEVGE